MVRFGLKFIKSEAPFLHKPVAQIFIDQSAGGDDKGNIFITCQCLSFDELDSQIELLKKELDQIKTKARKKFALQNKIA
jgi:hypothetical protein